MNADAITVRFPSGIEATVVPGDAAYPAAQYIEQLERRLEQALADKARETARANELADRLRVVKALADEWALVWERWHRHDRTGRFGVFRVHANRLRRAAAGGGPTR